MSTGSAKLGSRLLPSVGRSLDAFWFAIIAMFNGMQQSMAVQAFGKGRSDKQEGGNVGGDRADTPQPNGTAADRHSL